MYVENIHIFNFRPLQNVLKYFTAEIFCHGLHLFQVLLSAFMVHFLGPAKVPYCWMRWSVLETKATFWSAVSQTQEITTALMPMMLVLYALVMACYWPMHFLNVHVLMCMSVYNYLHLSSR